MSAIELLKKSFRWGPVLFGIGFVAPVIAQALDASATPPPFGLSSIQTGLAVGLLLGTVAKVRGRWI